MMLKRRKFLAFIGATAAIASHQPVSKASKNAQASASSPLAFNPVNMPIPLAGDRLEDNNRGSFQTYDVIDDVVLPEGYTYDVIAAWGDRVGDSRFGYNNDFVSFVATGPEEALLTINFEYISGKTWMQTYETVIGQSLPFASVKQRLNQTDGTIDFSTITDAKLKADIEAISKAGLIDQGIGVIKIKQQNGIWQRSPSAVDRRITGISGLEDGRYLQATGPAVHIFKKTDKQGYEDQLGDRIIGTFQNCAGGTTPWGTALSAEENFQDQVPEAVRADGSSMPPSETPFTLTDTKINGRGNPFGLAGNKYGWMVEVDPANPDDYGTKHTWLGRFRHEAVAIFAQENKPLAVYSGCDRRGGHLYKFVSQDQIQTLTDKKNSQLMTAGMLYGAKFNADGTGRWIALAPETRVNPVLPSQIVSVEGKGLVTVPNPDRTNGGIMRIHDDAAAQSLPQTFQTLGDFYIGNDAEKQGAILIDAHFAANAAGVTCTARPEDTTFDSARKILYIAFTSGGPDEKNGGPDRDIFKGPNGEVPYEYGWVMKLIEDRQDPAAMTFRWEMLAVGGEPADGGFGFSNPDNLDVDGKGNVWMVTDISTSQHNKAVEHRQKNGHPLKRDQLRGLFGNNSAWVIPTSGTHAGQAFPFAIGPMESELCGLCLTPDQQSLFLAAQHPGEMNGMRQAMATETRRFIVKTLMGTEITQNRTVPLGSNWPGKGENDPPKPALVVVRREDGKILA